MQRSTHHDVVFTITVLELTVLVEGAHHNGSPRGFCFGRRIQISVGVELTLDMVKRGSTKSMILLAYDSDCCCGALLVVEATVIAVIMLRCVVATVIAIMGNKSSGLYD